MTELYRPSCGTEGAWFISRWCCHCERERAYREEDGDGCDILARTFIHGTDHPDYPKEWRDDGPSGRRCTAFTPEADDPVYPQDPSAAVRDLFQPMSKLLHDEGIHRG